MNLIDKVRQASGEHRGNVEEKQLAATERGKVLFHERLNKVDEGLEEILIKNAKAGVKELRIFSDVTRVHERLESGEKGPENIGGISRTMGHGGVQILHYPYSAVDQSLILTTRNDGWVIARSDAGEEAITSKPLKEFWLRLKAEGFRPKFSFNNYPQGGISIFVTLP